MKRILLCLLCMVLLACCGCNELSPYAPTQVQNSTKVTYRVYVCGAVQNEGFVEVEQGSDYYALVLKAGMVEFSRLPDFGSQFVDGKMDSVVVDYVDEGGSRRNCVNCNGILVTQRLAVDGIDAEVINLIADFILQKGKVRNKEQLKECLGEKYQNNYYKFYVDKADYEENY